MCSSVKSRFPAHKMLKSSSGMVKRSLIITLVTIVAICYFYDLFGNQELVKLKTQNFVFKSKIPNKTRSVFSDSSKPSWTWLCESRRCVRKHLHPGLKTQSLLTCSMLCDPPLLWPEPTYYQSTTSITKLKPNFALIVKHSPSKVVTKLLKHAFNQFKIDVMKSMPSDWSRSDSLRSNNLRSNSLRSISSRSDVLQSDSQRSNNLRSDSLRPNNLRSDSLRSNNLRSDSLRSNSIRSDSLRSNSLRSDFLLSESLRSHFLRSDNKSDDHTRKLIILVNITTDLDPKLTLSTSEKYLLRIRAKSKSNITIVRIRAESFCGARHALETLSQMIWFDKNIGTFITYTKALIKDKPKFVYRSLMLDTARNYFPVKDILRTLDAMASVKLNTFHWHATDSQSFPIKFKSVPQFAWFGAYSRKQVYTFEDIKMIVNRARLRGIRVVIEIDGPAHVGKAWSWGNRTKFGEFATCIEAQPWPKFCFEPPCGQINPKNENVYELLYRMFKEIIKLTGVADVFHLGGDEVKPKCWKNENAYALWIQYLNKTRDALIRANNGLPEATIIWSSQLTRPPLKRFQDLVIQVWEPKDSITNKIILQEHYPVILSHVDAWYLDCGFGSFLGNKKNRNLCKYNSELMVYNHRPWVNYNMSVIGGEVCLWSELTGAESLESRLWPRAAAFAERLWSDPKHSFDPRTLMRLDLHRQRLVERGVGALALMPKWCTENPYVCASDQKYDYMK